MKLKPLVKLISLNVVIFFFVLEITSYVLILAKIIPKELPPIIALNAHSEMSYWHPINKKIKIATRCWESEVEFNNIGIKSSNVIKEKIKKRVAILGDSMTENLQLSNNKDFSYLLQSKLPDYEVINFSISSTGLADQIDVYKILIKKLSIDYLFLFITENDLNDNYIEHNRPNRLSYDYINNQIYEYPRNNLFFDEYFSKYSIFKREKISFLKNYLNSFKLYYKIKEDLNRVLYKNENLDKNLYKKEKIYTFLRNKFLKELDNDTKLLVFFNINNSNFLDMTDEKKILKKIWSINNVNDPQIDSIKYLKKINKLHFPYMGFTCDSHYSSLGAEFLSDYVSKKFYKIVN
jgi:hypothetical protein